MNRKLAIAILAAATGSAFADDITIDTTPFVSSESRAQVQAELAWFQQSGVNPWSKAYDQLRGFQSSKTRAAVVAEYLASRPQVAAFTGEDSGAAYLARSRAVRTSTTVAGQPRTAQ